MEGEWRGRVSKHILEAETKPINFYDALYGHIGWKTLNNKSNREEIILKEKLDITTLLSKVIERLGLDKFNLEILPQTNYLDVVHAVDYLISKGSTAYILPWYTRENEAYDRLYRPYFKIPVENMEPKRGILEYNYEYNGIYHLHIPDKYTGETYLNLLKEYAQTVLEVDGFIILDITYIHLLENLPNLIEQIYNLLEPVRNHLIIVSELHKSFLNPSKPITLVYTSGFMKDILLEVNGLPSIALDKEIINDLFILDLNWNNIVDEVTTSIKNKEDIMTGQLGEKGVLKGVYTYTYPLNNPYEIADRLLSENILVEPIDTPVEGININLYTDEEDLSELINKIKEAENV